MYDVCLCSYSVLCVLPPPLLPPPPSPVYDVCLWLDYVGLAQYRKKFVHHRVDGPMLLTMDDGQLKVDLGIGPLGHRTLLLQSKDALLTDFGDETGSQYTRSPPRNRGRPMSARTPQEFPRRPASASRWARSLGLGLGL